MKVTTIEGLINKLENRWTDVNVEDRTYSVKLDSISTGSYSDDVEGKVVTTFHIEGVLDDGSNIDDFAISRIPFSGDDGNQYLDDNEIRNVMNTIIDAVHSAISKINVDIQIRDTFDEIALTRHIY